MPASSRFSDRVQNYVRYRPGYPPDTLGVLRTECNLTAGHVVADIASGTGIWTRMLLENGNRVFGVEPNAEMRQAGERLLAEFPSFTSVSGTAEATTLSSESVDFISIFGLTGDFWLAFFLAPIPVALLGVATELLFLRPLYRRGHMDQVLLTFGTDYQDVRHERTTAVVNEFFDPAPFQERVFALRQEFDYEGLEGRLLSSSYAPGPGHRNHRPLLQELRRIFDEHADDKRVAFDYNTRVYFGRLK